MIEYIFKVSMYVILFLSLIIGAAFSYCVFNIKFGGNLQNQQFTVQFSRIHKAKC